MRFELVAQVPGELADRRRLAGAVDADDEDHRRVGPQVDLVVAGAGELGEQLGQPVRQRLAADERALLGLALELLDDLGGGRGADVGVDQRLLEALPGVLVEVALEQRGLDLGGERLARLAHVLAQAAEEAAALLLALGLVAARARAAPWSRRKRSYQSLAMRSGRIERVVAVRAGGALAWMQG